MRTAIFDPVLFLFVVLPWEILKIRGEFTSRIVGSAVVLQRMLDAVRVVRHGEGVSGPDCAMVVVCITVVRGSELMDWAAPWRVLVEVRSVIS